MPGKISGKIKRLAICVCLLFSPFSMVFAQGEAAVPFLLINPSPRLNGMAGAFTALPTTDPHGQYFNPAQLGNFSRERNFSIQLYTPETNWLPQFNYTDLTFSSRALAFGYNLQNYDPLLPISIGMGFINTNLSLGKNVYTDENGNVLGTFDSREYYTAYSIGIGFDYYVRFNMGYTYKKITSELCSKKIMPGYEHGKANAYDYGTLLVIPAISIIEKINNGEITIFGNFSPNLDLSFGYSILNIGEEIYYLDINNKDPLPRTAQIGAAFSLGIDMPIEEVNFTIAKFDWSSEARDLLVEQDSIGNREYVSAPGNIDFWENVIRGNTNNDVVIYKGWRIQIFDFFEISRGNLFEDIRYGARDVNTKGYRFTSYGLMKFLSLYSDNKIISYIADHIEISYAHSSYSTTDNDHLNNTKFNGMTISVFGY